MDHHHHAFVGFIFAYLGGILINQASLVIHTENELYGGDVLSTWYALAGVILGIIQLISSSILIIRGAFLKAWSIINIFTTIGCLGLYGYRIHYAGHYSTYLIEYDATLLKNFTFVIPVIILSLTFPTSDEIEQVNSQEITPFVWNHHKFVGFIFAYLGTTLISQGCFNFFHIPGENEDQLKLAMCSYLPILIGIVQLLTSTFLTIRNLYLKTWSFIHIGTALVSIVVFGFLFGKTEGDLGDEYFYNPHDLTYDNRQSSLMMNFVLLVPTIILNLANEKIKYGRTQQQMRIDLDKC